MYSKRPTPDSPVTPDALRLKQALQRNAPLNHLRALLAESNARFEAVRGHLPPALIGHVKPGPVDESGWSLLAANASVGAKLRQLQPTLEAALHAANLPTGLRIKVRAA